ncbi:hypothetical protein [Nostoc linckia]|nr:hypothetical protein [Nostoc linckia]
MLIFTPAHSLRQCIVIREMGEMGRWGRWGDGGDGETRRIIS